MCVCAAQVMEEDKNHGPVVPLHHVLQEEISLDSAGGTCRCVNTEQNMHHKCLDFPRRRFKADKFCKSGLKFISAVQLSHIISFCSELTV